MSEYRIVRDGTTVFLCWLQEDTPIMIEVGEPQYRMGAAFPNKKKAEKEAGYLRKLYPDSKIVVEKLEE